MYEANQQITDIIENMSECFFSLDKNLKFTYVNNQTVRSINLPITQILGKCILDVYPTEVPNEWQLAYEKVLEEREPFRGELFDTFSHRWYQVSLSPCREGGITGFFSDITEKVERESERQRLLVELETANQSLEAILNQLPAGIFVVHPSGEIIRSNNEATRICGISAAGASATSLPLTIEDWQRQRCVFRLDGTPLESNAYPMVRVINGETVRNEEYLIQTGEGKEIIINTNASPIVDQYNTIKAGVVTFIDITERKQVEEEMAKLERLNTIGEMAASIGHEIRNPLTTVRGYIQFFATKAKYVEQQAQFQTIIEELDRANAIITEFLSLAKNKRIELESNNLNSIILKIYPLIQADALNAGKSVTLALGEIPNIRVDENELRQCILNLVRNGLEAIKINGEVSIKTYLVNSIVVLEIKDNGEGVPLEVLKKFGTPFITTKDKGTGLGISICYRIVARHGATIEVDTSSVGTTFLIKFNCP